MKPEAPRGKRDQDVEKKWLLSRISSAVENAPYVLKERRVRSVVVAASCSSDSMQLSHLSPASRA